MSREIMYKNPELTKSPEKTETQESLRLEDLYKLVEVKSKKIVNWIKSHPAIKWSLICKSAGIDKGNFQRTLKSEKPKIKIEHIIKLEKELKQYGYE
jgi:hypothetical protein